MDLPVLSFKVTLPRFFVLVSLSCMSKQDFVTDKRDAVAPKITRNEGIAASECRMTLYDAFMDTDLHPELII